jgi:uncharacterized membrane protein YfcA
MTLLAAIALGALIGLSLGALGGGGSILTVPALVYVVGESAHAATTESLVIVGITSLAAAIGHARAGHVKWSAGLVFGLTGVASSYLGTAANRAVNPNVLLLAFAGLILIAAAAMLARQRGSGRRNGGTGAPLAAGRGGQFLEVGGGGTVLARPLTPTATLNRAALTPAVAAKVLAAGLAVGFLTGFFGVGGGFVIVPALVMALGYEMPIAVGTSLLVIAINSAAALLARSGQETFHWAVIVPFTVAAVAGSLAGKRVADRVEPATLTRAFVGLLFAVAIYVAVRSGIALTS